MDFNSQITKIKNVYFIGIGGIGMSAIARYFEHLGKNIAGYDKTPSQITRDFENRGVPIQYDENEKRIPFSNTKETIVIYTPAIPKENKIFKYFSNQNISFFKRAEILGFISKNSFCLAVAGTHGKTTTSAILGHIMKVCKTQATSFLGGILEGYESNLILGNEKTMVVEADEYDRSFLQLYPDIACVTSMDADHLDIYQTPENLQNTFEEFSQKVSKVLLVKKGLPLKGLTYSVEEKADYFTTHPRIEKGFQVFDLHTPKSILQNVRFLLSGKHNLSNALVAVAMAEQYGLKLPEIAKALESFQGIKRRFSYKIKTENCVLIDDYAHHPAEIEQVANAVREMYPDKKNTVIFQPHLFSRTKDFAYDFADRLGLFDEIFLLDIYPAREQPIQGVDSKWLLDKIKKTHKKYVSKTELLQLIPDFKNEIIVMLGAGDIGVFVDEVAKILNEKRK